MFKPIDQLTPEDMIKIRTVVGRVSADILSYIQDELMREGMTPDVAGLVILHTYGMLAGRYGKHGLGGKKMWQECTHSSLENMFIEGFKLERRKTTVV